MGNGTFCILRLFLSRSYLIFEILSFTQLSYFEILSFTQLSHYEILPFTQLFHFEILSFTQLSHFESFFHTAILFWVFLSHSYFILTLFSHDPHTNKWPYLRRSHWHCCLERVRGGGNVILEGGDVPHTTFFSFLSIRLHPPPPPANTVDFGLFVFYNFSNSTMFFKY